MCHTAFLGDHQNPPGHGPKQPPLRDPALGRGLDLVIPRSAFPPQ